MPTDHDPVAVSLEEAVRDALVPTRWDPFQLRAAGLDDAEVLLGLLDEAVQWLRSLGHTGQWGTRPFSTRTHRVRQAAGWVASGGTVLATLAEEVVGGLVLGAAPHYVPPASAPELYVVLLVGSRQDRARGVGRTLLAFAEQVAKQLPASRLRVDCYAGGGGALVRYYQSAGFVPQASFEVDGWPGQVLERRW